MATAETTVIGRSTVVHGRLTGDGDVSIVGRVEGDVACSGEVVVEDGGLVAANITARRIVVRGAVKGDLTAEEAIVLEAAARVVGDLRAERIAIAEGGLARGQLQTGKAGAARPRAAQTAARAASPAAKAAPAKAPHRAERTNHESSREAAPRGATLAGARVGPPPPVVPALKKGTKAVHKKR